MVIKLFFKGALSPLDTAVICWPAWRQDGERYVQIFASLFKPGHEFRAAVHLYGFYGERCFVDQFSQEPLGGRGFGM